MKIFIFSFLLCFFSIPGFAQVYQCIDSDGHVSYSNKPCDNTEAVKIIATPAENSIEADLKNFLPKTLLEQPEYLAIPAGLLLLILCYFIFRKRKQLPQIEELEQRRSEQEIQKILNSFHDTKIDRH